jgi:hypothetical protein
VTMWRKRIACWIPKATNTRTQNMTCCFPLQQWVLERASILRYKYTAGLAAVSRWHKHFLDYEAKQVVTL